MKIPAFVCASLFSLQLAITAWMATEIIALKVNVATLTVQIQNQKHASNQP